MNRHGPVFTAPLITFLLSLALSPAAKAEEGAVRAQELINKMTQATRTQNYEGVFIYRYGKTMDTMRIIHKADNGGEKQRLVSLTGSAREVIRNNESVTCIFPDDRAVMVEKSRARKLVFQLPQPIESVSRLYAFSTSGEDRIAGRESWTVNITPRDEYRYGYRLWIDQDSYLLLKSELRDTDNDVLEQILFTQLEIHDQIAPEMLEPSLTGKDYTWYRNDTEKQAVDIGNKSWRVTWVPDGFNMETHQSQIMPMSKQPVQHIIYTDGIAIVSVFIEEMKNADSGSIGAMKKGGVNTFARHENGYQITAVGEVPHTTVERMAKSVVAQN